MMMMMRQNKRFRDSASFRLFFPPKTLFFLFLYLFFFLFLFFSRASSLASSSSSPSSSPSSSFASSFASSVTKNARKKTHAGTDRPTDPMEREKIKQNPSSIEMSTEKRGSIRLRDARCEMRFDASFFQMIIIMTTLHTHMIFSEDSPRDGCSLRATRPQPTTTVRDVDGRR